MINYLMETLLLDRNYRFRYKVDLKTMKPHLSIPLLNNSSATTLMHRKSKGIKNSYEAENNKF